MLPEFRFLRRIRDYMMQIDVPIAKVGVGCIHCQFVPRGPDSLIQGVKHAVSMSHDVGVISQDKVLRLIPPRSPLRDGLRQSRK